MSSGSPSSPSGSSTQRSATARSVCTRCSALRAIARTTRARPAAARSSAAQGLPRHRRSGAQGARRRRRPGRRAPPQPPPRPADQPQSSARLTPCRSSAATAARKRPLCPSSAARPRTSYRDPMPSCPPPPCRLAWHGAAGSALLVVAADPAARSPLRLAGGGAVVGHRWCHLGASQPDELAWLERRLAEQYGRRLWLQQQADADLTTPDSRSPGSRSLAVPASCSTKPSARHADNRQPRRTWWSKV